jgi:hypothetical protein
MKCADPLEPLTGSTEKSNMQILKGNSLTASSQVASLFIEVKGGQARDFS